MFCFGHYFDDLYCSVLLFSVSHPSHWISVITSSGKFSATQLNKVLNWIIRCSCQARACVLEWGPCWFQENDSFCLPQSRLSPTLIPRHKLSPTALQHCCPNWSPGTIVGSMLGFLRLSLPGLKDNNTPLMFFINKQFLFNVAFNTACTSLHGDLWSDNVKNLLTYQRGIQTWLSSWRDNCSPVKEDLMIVAWRLNDSHIKKRRISALNLWQRCLTMIHLAQLSVALVLKTALKMRVTPNSPALVQSH